MTLKTRIEEIEKEQPETTNVEWAVRIQRVLENPYTVPQAIYNRMIELLNIARARKQHHEQPKQQN
jgi:hypothetical protein